MGRRAVLTFALLTGAVLVGSAVTVLGSAKSRTAMRKTPTLPTRSTKRFAAVTAPVLFPSPNEAAVVDAANAFLATLTEKQRTVAEIELTHPLAAKWSNFPSAVVPRNGIFFLDMSAAQADAALKIARLALSPEGYQRFEGVRAADDQFAKIDKGPGGGPGGPRGRRGPGGPVDSGGPLPGGGPGGFDGGPGSGGSPFGGANLFGKGNYMIAFLGKPSKTEPWLLQIGGHHLAFNLLYKGATGAATPYFLGVEPTSWKDAQGNTHAPMAPMRDAMYGLVTSLTPEQRSVARLTVSFHDVLVGPGQDGRFPEKSEGTPVTALSPTSREFVKRAIVAWTGDNAQSAAYRKLYLSELAQTKIAHAGTTTLDRQGDYVRIDGPHVWIEFSCQGGIVVRNQIHYHTIWRDRQTDYGAAFAE